MSQDSNIIIVSHRRSGTHLLADLIVNNFSYNYIESNYIDYDKFFHKGPNYDNMAEFKAELEKGPSVTFTHSHNYQDYLKRDIRESDKTFLNNLFKQSKIILVVRDIRDIVSSLYNRPKNRDKYKDFDDFYDNYDYDDSELIDESYDDITESIMQYYRNWMSILFAKDVLELDVEVVCFEDMIIDYKSVVDRISKFIGKEPEQIKDVRSLKDKTLQYTAHDFHKGTIGDWKNHIDAQRAHKMFQEHTNIIANIDSYRNFVKVSKHHIPEREKHRLDTRAWNTQDQDWRTDYSHAFQNQKDKPRAAPHRAAGAKKFSKCPLDIEKRYTECSERHGDPRYGHKVFFYDDVVLKFIDPVKCYLSKQEHAKVSPILCEELLDKIILSDEILYNNGIVPKLHYAGIYKNTVCVIQDKVNYRISGSFDSSGKWPAFGTFDWVFQFPGLFRNIVKYFRLASADNIVLSDIVNPYNLCWHKYYEYLENGTYIDETPRVLTYLDVHGIEYCSSREHMLGTPEFHNTMNILVELDNIHERKYGNSLLKGTLVYEDFSRAKKIF